MPSSQAVMLPTNIKPSRYILALEPDMEASSFLGHETIEVDVLTSTSTITLNASELQISSCRILSAGGDTLTATSITPATTTAQYSGTGSRRPRADRNVAGADGAASCESELCGMSLDNGPTRLRLRKLQRDRCLA